MHNIRYTDLLKILIKQRITNLVIKNRCDIIQMEKNIVQIFKIAESKSMEI